VSEQQPAAEPTGATLLELYDRALPQVYGYLFSRCRNAAMAEDLTSETFVAAVDAVRRDAVQQLTVAWLVGVARHKLVDQWRRLAVEERAMRVMADEPAPAGDGWDEQLDVTLAHAALARLGAHHRAALTLRYLDGLSVPEVAAELGRSLHATEALLVRARWAFRRAYGEGRDDG
jgi:RNA polymerase sigma-70 factor, ECF subfamily